MESFAPVPDPSPGRNAHGNGVQGREIWEAVDMASRASKTPQRRRGRPSGGGPDTRTALIEAALTLMNEQPWQRVSAKAVADAAGCDPALVTYHFGGRDGLLSAVGERAAHMLRERMSLGYADSPGIAEALRRAVGDPVNVMVDHPLLAQLYVGELLLHGRPNTDVALHDMAVPYFEHIQVALEAAYRSGSVRDVDRSVLLYTVAALSLVPFFLGPMFDRGVATSVATADAAAFSAALTDVVLHGALAGGDNVAEARRGSFETGVVADSGISPAIREELILAAIELLRHRPASQVTVAALAEATGREEAVLSRYFPASDDLMTAVAQAAARMLPQTGAQSGRRGRPPTENSDFERRFVVAATEVAAEGVSVSVRSVAARAGGDPALVTYYFGGRRGLIQTVALRVMNEVVGRVENALGTDAPLADRLEGALRSAVWYVSDQPNLAHLVMDEFLLRGDKKSDSAMRPLTSRYWKLIGELVDEGVAVGAFRKADPEILRYVVGVMPIFVAAATPLLHRALRGPVVAAEPERLSNNIVDLMLNGLFHREDGDQRAGASAGV